jgi:hypothetical protein
LRRGLIISDFVRDSIGGQAVQWYSVREGNGVGRTYIAVTYDSQILARQNNIPIIRGRRGGKRKSSKRRIKSNQQKYKKTRKNKRHL